MKTSQTLGLIVVLLIAIGLIALLQPNDEPADVTNDQPDVVEQDVMMDPTMDVVENVSAADNLTTLVAAVQAAGLVETLQGPGPFTVFAPSDDAFDALPEGSVEALLLPENQAALSAVLAYHVVPGAYTSADLVDGQELTTVQGEVITIGKDGNELTVNGDVMVGMADGVSSNGVVYVIDTVLTPPSALQQQ
jgi:uncharacterized surface protein with fasciclin (FAS1) repeats